MTANRGSLAALKNVLLELYQLVQSTIVTSLGCNILLVMDLPTLLSVG